MAIKNCLLALLLIAFLLSILHSAHADDGDANDYDDTGDARDDNSLPSATADSSFNRTIFPLEFVFGAGSSAFQIEGAADRRGKNIWDTFTETHPDKIKDGSNATIADDSYYRYREDVTVINQMGFDSYRFSISWTRILPYGKRSLGINRSGVDYYNRLIDYVIQKGMQPFVTLFHWDLPQYLEDEYNGFLNRTIVDDFADYADLCFRLYGEKVKNWVTMNDPYVYSVMGYAYGAFPPNRCTPAGDGQKKNSEYGFDRFMEYAPPNCSKGDSGTEPYIVTHNMLLAHATAVKLYRDKYQAKQQGQIGITLNSKWYEPHNEQLRSDRDASLRALAFGFGWYVDPLTVGTYPTQMVTYVGDRLPTFDSTESALVKGSYDFIGINYFTSIYAKNVPCENSTNKSYLTDSCVLFTHKNRNGEAIGFLADNLGSYINIFPLGLRRLLVHTKDHYNNPPLYIAENGVGRTKRGYAPHDKKRTNYHHHHLVKVHSAMDKENVNVKGYFMWSLMDDFEWLDGYTVHFGLIYIDRERGTLNRYCKDSAKWFNKFLLKNTTEICTQLSVQKTCVGKQCF